MRLAGRFRRSEGSSVGVGPGSRHGDGLTVLEGSRDHNHRLLLGPQVLDEWVHRAVSERWWSVAFSGLNTGITP